MSREAFAPPAPPKIAARPLERSPYQIGMSAAPNQPFRINNNRNRGAAAAGLQNRRVANAAAAVGNKPSENIFKEVVREDKDVLRFKLSPTLVEYANALRRVMITEVETVGFRADILPNGRTSDVEITKNSTAMSNEMLAHRIGLLPIHWRTPLTWDPTQYTFKLNVVNESAEPRDVVAADFEVYQNRGPDEDPLKVPSLEFFNPDPITRDTCLLAILKGKISGQEPESIALEARATVGTGRENARFMPTTSRCAFGYTLDDDPEHRKEVFTRWLRTHKKLDPAELEADSEKKAKMEREFATMEVQRCYKVDAAGEPFSFDFIVESVGVLDSVYIVGRALDVLQSKLLRYASIDTGDLPKGLKVKPADALMKGFDFTFQNEDHTLGIILWTWMEKNQVDSEEITMVGYKVPHPLRDEMVLRVGVKDGMETSARAAVARASRECAQMFKNWRVMWSGATEGLAPVNASSSASTAGEMMRPGGAGAAGAGAASAGNGGNAENASV